MGEGFLMTPGGAAPTVNGSSWQRLITMQAQALANADASPELYDCVGRLLHKLREDVLTTGCERADFCVDKGDLDLKISEAESKLRLQRQINDSLLRRVRMLEQVLHEERVRHAAVLRASGIDPPPSASALTIPIDAATHLPPQLPLGALQSGDRPVLEARLRRRRPAPSSREILQSYLLQELAASEPELVDTKVAEETVELQQQPTQPQVGTSEEEDETSWRQTVDKSAATYGH
mmetsp:Transcript_65777/g.129617  ORF Transcript_65777/g.129617 Transcript_65777/m.129617 type:complete len:235 (+) Transcript_65777:56-760(+)